MIHSVISYIYYDWRWGLRICRFKSQLLFVIKSKYCSIYVFRTSWKCNPGTFSWPQRQWILICWYDHTCRDVFVIRVKWVMTENKITRTVIETVSLLDVIRSLFPFLSFQRSSLRPWLLDNAQSVSSNKSKVPQISHACLCSCTLSLCLYL